MNYKTKSCSVIVLFVSMILAGCGFNKEGTEPANSKSKEESSSTELTTVRVVSDNLKKEMKLPGELLAFRDVPIYPKVQGFVRSINVDRGASVKQGQILLQIEAPELNAQYGEAEGKLEAAQSNVLEMQSKIESSIADQREAEAKLASDEAVYKRIQHAAKTPGAVAETDLEEAQQKVAADRAHVQAVAQSVAAGKSQLNSEKARVKASRQALSSISEMRDYLTITAPFDGIITERNVHEGALVSSASSSKPLLRIQQISRLRLLVPVPELATGGIRQGMPLKFTVPAFTGKVFTATVQRIGHALDLKTRSMPVEADVQNSSGALEPGMYPEIEWEMQRHYPTLFVPADSVISSQGKTFVVKVQDGVAQHVHVSRGQSMRDLVEVVGDLKVGDEVVVKPSEDLSDGSRVSTHLEAGNQKEEKES